MKGNSMKTVMFLFLPVVLLLAMSCERDYPNIVSAEYVNEDTCRIGYRGSWITKTNNENPFDGDPFDDFFVYEKGDSFVLTSYKLKKGTRCDDDWWHKSSQIYYVLYQADRNWVKGKTIRVELYFGWADFDVPNQ